MKKNMFFSFLIVLVLLSISNTASAQCNDYGAGYDCWSVSTNGNNDSDGEVFSSDGSLFWVYVNLETNHPTDAYAYAEIATNAGYWTHTISHGTYVNSFTVAGDGPGGSLSLYTDARYGEAFIYASW